MQSVRFWIYIVITALLVSLGVVVYLQDRKIKKINSELSTAVINIKAAEAENDSLINKNIEFNYTIEQLNYSQDSLIQVLNNMRKSLKIKDKHIKELQYLASQNRKTDTLHLRDTIFREKEFCLDTVIGDEWAKLQLHLQYPSEIVADYSFKNETMIFSSTRKETIDPPKKCWLLRLFQKKHTITDVEVVQNNPYCENDLHKHIKIVN